MPTICIKATCKTHHGESVIVVGNHHIAGDWDPLRSEIVLSTCPNTYPVWSTTVDLPEGIKFEFKFAVLRDHHVRWEDNVGNRSLTISSDVASLRATFNALGEDINLDETAKEVIAAGYTPPPAICESLQPPMVKEVPKCESSADGQISTMSSESVDVLKNFGAEDCTTDFIAKLTRHNAQSGSYRQKLEIAQTFLKDGSIGGLQQLACLQAYLNFVASGQIKCREDGGHHRPNHAANASRSIMDSLRKVGKLGGAESFIVRRIFPSLPSFSDSFTCAVPMTRIRDIAHRNDIPHELKQEIKHTLQNKLHRCADPGDLETCRKLVERIRSDPSRYPGAFVEQMEIFFVELKEFFNAANLDELLQKIASKDSRTDKLAAKLLRLKSDTGNQIFQMVALTELRLAVKPLAESEQAWLLLDIELEKYAFVLLSGITSSLERSPQKGQCLEALQMALRHLAMSGVYADEASIVAHELEANGPPTLDRAWLLRTLSSAQRALRICFTLQNQLAKAYAGVAALADPLQIEKRAVDVLLEAELRASVLFQISKLAQLAAHTMKAELGIPNWVSVSAGAACGRSVRVSALEDLWKKMLPEEGAIAFCDTASGEEEVPPGCKGVVVNRDLPVLSHLAVRARQMGVVFACTSEDALFRNCAKHADGTPLKLHVSNSGTVDVSEISGEVLTVDAKKDAKTDKVASETHQIEALKLGRINLDEARVVNASAIEQAKPDIVGAKAASAGRLQALASQKVLEGEFLTPISCAISFGVMSSIVKGEAFEKALSALELALESSAEDVAHQAAEVRNAVMNLNVPPSIIDNVVKAFPDSVAEVAVRSSANSEDLEQISGAGLHDSVLGVAIRCREDLEKAVLQVWSSLFTLRAVQSRHHARLPLYQGISMGVLVQQMASSVVQGTETFSFIMFSENVSTNDKDSVYLEMCVGLGETLASGNVVGTPYRISVLKAAPHSVQVISLGNFSYAMRTADSASRGVEHVLIDYSCVKLSADAAYLEALAKRLAKVALRVEQFYGTGMDMEGVVVEDAGEQHVYLVQARPIVKA